MKSISGLKQKPRPLIERCGESRQPSCVTRSQSFAIEQHMRSAFSSQQPLNLWPIRKMAIDQTLQWLLLQHFDDLLILMQVDHFEQISLLNLLYEKVDGKVDDSLMIEGNYGSAAHEQ